jgi:hypothetical protein
MWYNLIAVGGQDRQPLKRDRRIDTYLDPLSTTKIWRNGQQMGVDQHIPILPTYCRHAQLVTARPDIVRVVEDVNENGQRFRIRVDYAPTGRHPPHLARGNPVSIVAIPQKEQAIAKPHRPSQRLALRF